MDNQLTHYGIKGMKWGVRRRRKSTPSSPSADYTKAKQIKKKRISEMSNDELKALTQRLQLEKQYRDLSPDVVNRGKNEVQQILKNAAKQTATNFISKGMTKAVDLSLKEIMRRAGK